MDKILLYFYIDKIQRKKKIYKIKGQNFVHLSNLGSSTLVEIASHQGWEPLDKLLDKIFHLSSELFHKVLSALGALRLDRIGQNAGQMEGICPICPILSTELGEVTKVLCKMTKVELDIWTKSQPFVQSLRNVVWTFGQTGWTLCPFVQSGEKSIIMDFWLEVRFNRPNGWPNGAEPFAQCQAKGLGSIGLKRGLWQPVWFELLHEVIGPSLLILSHLGNDK